MAGIEERLERVQRLRAKIKEKRDELILIAIRDSQSKGFFHEDKFPAQKGLLGQFVVAPGRSGNGDGIN